MNKILNDIFYDPKLGLSSFEKFKIKVRVLHPEIKIKDIKEFYHNQEVNQINKKPNYTDLKNKMFKINGPELSFQIDLIFIPKDILTHEKKKATAENAGLILNTSLYVFLLCEDILSRKAYIYYLSDKKDTSIMAAYEKFLLDVKRDTEKLTDTLDYYERNKPFAIITDDGFNFKKFTKLNESLDISVDAKTAYNDHITGGDRLGIIDRLVRTVKSIYIKFIYSQANVKYSPKTILKNIIENYNNTVHRSLSHHTPNEVFENKKERMQIFNNNDEYNNDLLATRNFNIGDMVRIYEAKGQFGKEKPQFSKALFKVVDIERGYKVYVEDVKGVLLKRGLKSYEMLKVNVDNIQNKNPIDINAVIKVNKKIINQEKILKQLDINNGNILNTKRIKIKNTKYS